MRLYSIWPKYLLTYIGILLLDMLVQFNSAYYKKGRIVEDRKKIIVRYCRFHFILDLACLLSVVEHYKSDTFNF